MREVRTLTVAAAEAGEDGVRLDRWFKRRWPHLNHVQIQKLARSGQIRVDGARAKPETRLNAGSEVRVPPLPDAPAKGEREGLSQRDIAYAKSLVLYEDDEVLALNKPSGLAVQGGTKTTKHIDRLLSAWGEGLERPRLVHRLDRDTSGVLVLGKTPGAAARLSGAFAKRKGQERPTGPSSPVIPSLSKGVIELHLAKKGVGDREMVVPADPKDPRADPAETEYVTLARAAHRAAWMALRPTHRAHPPAARAHAGYRPCHRRRSQVWERGVGRPLRRAEVAAARSPSDFAASLPTGTLGDRSAPLARR